MRKIILLLSCLLVIPASFAVTEYKLDYKLPKSAKLHLFDQQEDADGYTRRYKVITNEKSSIAEPMSMVMMTHGRKVRLTPKQAMEEVVQVHAQANCAQKGDKVIKLYDSVIIFMTYLDQCANGKSLVQIYKSFNTPSGQYAINYSANPQDVSKETMQKMQEMVKVARIVPINESIS